MDKVGLLNRISALSRHFCAGQSLREPGMDRGQKLAWVKKAGFCTSDAVDIQLLVHRRLLVGAGRRWFPVSEQVGGQSMSRLCRCCDRFFFKSAFQNDLQRRCWSGICSAQLTQFVYLKACIQNSSNSKRGIFCG